MSMNKSFQTLAATTTVALPTFGMAACDGSTVGSPEITLSMTTKTFTASSSTETSAPRSSEKSAPETTDPQAKRMDEAPDGQIEFSEADDSYLGTLEKVGIGVNGMEDQLIGIGRAACADVPEEKHQVIALAIAGQLIAQNRSQDNAGEVAKIITSPAEKVYR